MDASDLETIENILRNYGVHELLDFNYFNDLVDELRNRENIMIVDALDRNPQEI